METSIKKPVDRQDTVKYFTPFGDLTVINAPEVRAEIKRIIAEGARELVIDLTNTHMIDSTGIGLLVATHNSIARLNGKLRLVNVSQELLELLKAFRLDKHFSISGSAN